MNASPKDESELHLVGGINLDKRLGDWVAGAVKVKAVVFDCTEGALSPGFGTNRRLVEEGVEHPFIIRKASKYLTATEIADLADLVTGEHEPPSAAGCYVPHHGFIFYGEDNSIVANIEICLMCGRGYEFPDRGLAESWDFEGLTEFISAIGLPVFEDAADWRSYFEKNQQEVEQGGGGNGGQRR